MSMLFADTLKRLRAEKELSQNEIAKRMYVTRVTVSRWESGNRLPDAAMIYRLSEVLGADINILLSAAAELILQGGLPILNEVFPYAEVTGFTKPSEAVEYSKSHRIALAFLDIEMGNISGLDVCRSLIKINPQTNVLYLTAYKEYAFDAWSTGACGFILKPLTAESIKEHLEKLRYPFNTGGESV